MRPLVAVLAALLLALGAFFLMDFGSADGDSSSVAPLVEGAGEAGDEASDGPQLTPITPESEREDVPEFATPAAAAGQVASGDQDHEPRPEAVLLTGRVLGPLGKPIPGAEVHVGQSSSADLFALPAPAERRPLGTSDEEGFFELSVRLRGGVQLSVGAAGHVPYARDVVVSSKDRQDVGIIELDQGVLLSGRVLDTGGRGIAGAELRRPPSVRDSFVIMNGMGPLGDLVATTDDDGHFTIDRLAVGPFRFSASSEVHPAALLEGETSFPGEKQAGLIVTLEDGWSISGRVLDLPESTDEALVVQATEYHGEISFDQIDEIEIAGRGRVTELEPDGSFEVRGLRGPAEHRVGLRANDGGFGRASRSASQLAQAGDREVELRYSHGATLVFQVVDGRDSSPVTNFRVEAGSSWERPLMDAQGVVQTEHPEGRVRFEGLWASADGLVSLSILSAGFERLERRGIRLPESGEVDLGRIALDPVPVVRVEVRDASTGAAVEGAEVRLAVIERPEPVGAGDDDSERRTVRIRASAGSPPSEILDVRHEAVTDAEGLAVLSSVPGENARISVEAQGLAPWKSERLSLPHGQDVDLSASMTAGGAVLVRVVGSQGKPVAGVGIRHKLAGGGHSGFVVAGHGTGERVSDEAGEVLYEHLAPGEHLFQLSDQVAGTGGVGFVSIEMEGFSEGDQGWTKVEVFDAQVAELELVAPEPASLVGVVTEAGKPLAGATLTLTKPQDENDPMAGMAHRLMGPSGPKASTDGLGRYRIEGATAGEWELTLTHAERAMSDVLELELEGGKNERDLALDLAIVEGRVLDTDGEAVQGALVKVERAQPRGGRTTRFAVRMIADDGGDTVIFGGSDALPLTAYTDAEGKYSLRGVTPNVQLQVEASSDAHQTSRSEDFEVAEDEIHSGVEVVLEGAGSLAVFIKRADGTPAQRVVTRASFQGESEQPVSPGFGMTNQEGRMEIASLKPGPWELVIELGGPRAGKGEAPEPVTVEVVAGESVPVEIELP